MLRRHINVTSKVLSVTSVTASKALCTTGATATSPLRIYTSDCPSVRDQFESSNTLCQFMLDRWATAPEGKIACIQQETKQKYNYKELTALTHNFANIFYHHAKVRKGSVVCIMMLDHILYPPIAFGILKAGGVVTTTNAVATSDTLSYHLEKSGAEVLIGMRVFSKTAEATAKMVRKTTGKEIRVLYMDDLMGMEAPAMPSSYTALEDGKPDDVIFLPFSSGTMGNPKAVQLTNRNLTANICQAVGRFNILDTDVFATVLPFFHIFGFAVIMSTALAYNSTQVIMMKYAAEVYTQTIKEYKCTSGFVAPPIVSSLVQQLRAGKISKDDFATVDTMLSSSAPLSPTVAAEFQRLVPNVQMCQGWGMSEMSPAVAVFPRFSEELDYKVAGCLVPDTELRIVRVDDDQQSGADKSSGIDCEPGQDGEIWVRGPQLMKGYLNKEDNVAAFQDGWYRTGDIGHFDAKTCSLTVTSRLKELIKYKGFQVSPSELETEVLKHPWVVDCMVVGVPDPRDVSFEMPRALVVLQPDLPSTDVVNATDDIYRFIMTHSPPHKRLHGGVRVVNALPRSAAGKLLRRQAREEEVKLMTAYQQVKGGAARDDEAKETASSQA